MSQESKMFKKMIHKARQKEAQREAKERKMKDDYRKEHYGI